MEKLQANKNKLSNHNESWHNVQNNRGINMATQLFNTLLAGKSVNISNLLIGENGSHDYLKSVNLLMGSSGPIII